MARLLALGAACVLWISTLPAQWQTIGNVDSYTTQGATGVVFKASGATLDVRLLADDVARIRLTPPAAGTAILRDHSWAVVDPAWPPPHAEIADAADAVTITTPALRVHITKRPLRITFFDPKGNVLNQDHPGKGMAWTQHSVSTGPRAAREPEVRVWKVMPQEERYYGFGEKGGPLEKRGMHMTMWNSDIPAYSTATDPLYKSIPFFLAIRQGQAHGIFLDNTAWTSFDMGKEARDQYVFGAAEGALDYYFLAGPSPKDVVRRYTELVGRMPPPPRWSLGYQQCRWSYAPEQRVRDIARGFRDNRIPCDVLYLDIDYMEGYRVFTWSSANFPDPRKLISDLAADGFRVAVILDPGIKVDSSYAAYRTGLAGKHFLTYPDGRVFVGDVWPGPCAFPDFSAEKTRRWWGDLMADLITTGVRGYWNDMNEPSVFHVPTKTVDLTVVHDDNGLRTPHTKNHNVYGLQMTRASYEGALRHNPAERPFVLTRATYAGGQRYSAVWTGDNVASWDHLGLALTMCLNLGLSGHPFTGSDIGGFIGYPSGELFARWLQLGVFTPLMRAHSVINEKDKEPWAFGEDFTAINRSTIALRYRLMPTLYGIMHEASQTGIPAMRPLVLEYPDEPRFAQESTVFLFGNDLLVAPVLSPGTRQRDVPLPPGEWYDFWTGEHQRGGGTVSASAPLDRIPVFVRAGALLPTQQEVQYTGEQPIDPLTVTVYPLTANGTSSRMYYEDDGISFDYQKGVYLRRQHSMQRIGSTTIIDFGAAEGTYTPASRTLEVRVVDIRTRPASVLHNGTSLEHRSPLPAIRGQSAWSYDDDRHQVVIRCPDLLTSQRIEIRHD